MLILDIFVLVLCCSNNGGGISPAWSSGPLHAGPWCQPQPSLEVSGGQATGQCSELPGEIASNDCYDCYLNITLSSVFIF